MGTRMDKTRILAKIAKERAALDAALIGLTEEQMEEPGVQDHWSVKDLLAHIAFWDNHLAGRLEAALRDEPPPIERFRTADEANAHVYTENRDRPLTEIMAEAAHAYGCVQQAIEQLSDADLTDPQRYAWAGRRPLRWHIYIDSYGHYPEHVRAIQAWRARTSSPATS